MARAHKKRIAVGIEITKVPVSRHDDSSLMKRILLYSAMNKKANPAPPYSTLKPETSSDSPSAKSNGARFVSAKITTVHIAPRGKNSMMVGVEKLVRRIEVMSICIAR